MFLVRFTAGRLPVLSTVLFVVCPNYQEDICLTSLGCACTSPTATAFQSRVVDNVFKVEVLVESIMFCYNVYQSICYVCETVEKVGWL